MSLKINSIQTKIMSVSLLIAIGTVVASLLISYYTETRIVKKTAEKYMEQYVTFADRDFNVMLNDSKKVVLSVALAQDIISHNLLEKGEEVTYEGFQKKKQIKDFLSGFFIQKEYIQDILLIMEDGQVYQGGENFVFRKDLETEAMKTALSSEVMELFYDSSSRLLLLSRPVFYENRSKKGTIVIHLNYDYMMAAYEIEPLNAMNIYLYLPDGQLLFSNTDHDETQISQDIRMKKEGKGYVDWGGERQYYTKYLSDTSKMTLITLIPQHLILKDVENLKQKFLLIGIFASLAAILASWFLAERICMNIRSLSKGMESVNHEGNLSVRMEIKTNDEIGNLADTFNTMMDRIENLMEEIAGKEKMRWEAEQDVLASQIEPHFLYNSIDSMQYVAHLREEDEIESVAKSLSSLLRSVLSNRNEYITLWEEKDYVNDFIAIERFKYSQPFDVVWDVDEELWVYPVPKLLLQPVVENALIHGISSRSEGGMINIKIYRQESEVICKIMDNGKGMSEETLRKLLDHVNEQERSGFRRIGIANVFNRIKLIYGEPYGGTIYSCEGMFTCVELCLPFGEGV